ncbi:MAG: hypothetical protein V6Z81_09585 [Parvularculales bacterium]
MGKIDIDERLNWKRQYPGSSWLGKGPIRMTKTGSSSAKKASSRKSGSKEEMNKANENVVELDPSGPTTGQSGGNGGVDLNARVAVLEAEIKHLATKASVLGGVLGGMGVAAFIAAIIVKWL